LAILAAIAAGPLPAAAQSDIFVQLEDDGFDMELDLAREQLYVSIPNQNEVVVISLVTGQVAARVRLDERALVRALGSVPEVLVGTRPHGLDLSLAGSTLFVALNEASSVVYVDLDTLGLTQVVIGSELGNSKTWDVIEGKPDRIFASANPGSGGLAYIVMIERDAGDAASRVASNRILRARPTFARSPDGQFLYVGTGFSPNSLYKLDLSTDAAPIVLEDDHGSVSGTDQLEVSPDGNRIYLGSGQVLDTSDFVQIGLVGSGIPRLNADGSLAYVADEPGSVEVYETTFFTKVDEIALPCSFGTIRAFELLDDGNGFLLLGDDNVCGVGSVTFQNPRCEVTPSYAGDTLTLGFELATPDPVLWNLWVSASVVTAKLWSLPIGVIDPPVSFELPIPGFPQIGKIGFLTTFVGGDGISCSDWAIVDTGAPTTAVDPAELGDRVLRGISP
jgi:hypothetical protein